MQKFLLSIEKALENKDWYGALSTALTIPDICAKIENPNRRGKQRYKEWYEKWLQHKYTMNHSSHEPPHVFLNSDDCYGLRCSYLHEGGAELEDNAKRSLERFFFIAPNSNGGSIHNVQVGLVLQLQVDIFCRDIVSAAREWESEVLSKDPDAEDKMKSLLRIQEEVDGKTEFYIDGCKFTISKDGN